MRRSKFVGKTYGNWKVTEMFLAANYGHGTKHNSYRYELVRITSDEKCYKKMTVSGTTMRKIARHLVEAEEVAENKYFSEVGPRSTIYYTFII